MCRLDLLVLGLGAIGMAGLVACVYIARRWPMLGR
mgnify:FL=1